MEDNVERSTSSNAGAEGRRQDVEVGELRVEKLAVVAKRRHSAELALVVLQSGLPEGPIRSAARLVVSACEGITDGDIERLHRCPGRPNISRPSVEAAVGACSGQVRELPPAVLIRQPLPQQSQADVRRASVRITSEVAPHDVDIDAPSSASTGEIGNQVRRAWLRRAGNERRAQGELEPHPFPLPHQTERVEMLVVEPLSAIVKVLASDDDVEPAAA